MKYYATLFLTLSLPALAPAQNSAPLQSPAYKECISLSNKNANAALAKADEWLTLDQSVAAHHCRAMALFGLGRFGEAAEALNTARTMIPADNLSLRGFVTKQLASAWVSGNRSDLAIGALDAQLQEIAPVKGNNASNAKLTSELLLERARVQIPFGKTLDAMRDLDHAVSLTPLNTDVLMERAQTFLMLGDSALARSDVEAVLTLNPHHTKARALLSTLDRKKL